MGYHVQICTGYTWKAPEPGGWGVSPWVGRRRGILSRLSKTPRDDDCTDFEAQQKMMKIYIRKWLNALWLNETFVNLVKLVLVGEISKAVAAVVVGMYCGMHPLNQYEIIWNPYELLIWVFLIFVCIFLAWGLRGQRDAAETWAASSALQIPCICPDGSSASGSIGLPRYWCLSMSQYSSSTRAQALVIFACQYFSTKQ